MHATTRKTMPRDALDRGRDAVERRAWRDAHDLLSAADQQSPLAPLDLERLAIDDERDVARFGL